ncbi:uncharacterized protein RHO25_002377 [Cercospora beticola]|uniref:Uncharacterized protein n=1 Tax=Cercospora beticola TaxID=122368 RepID=A0ABZ0NE07_CERBT|nr:hypothetical protein RHO25_002377 [Cercospora beticola]
MADGYLEASRGTRGGSDGLSHGEIQDESRHNIQKTGTLRSREWWTAVTLYSYLRELTTSTAGRCQAERRDRATRERRAVEVGWSDGGEENARRRRTADEEDGGGGGSRRRTAEEAGRGGGRWRRAVEEGGRGGGGRRRSGESVSASLTPGVTFVTLTATDAAHRVKLLPVNLDTLFGRAPTSSASQKRTHSQGRVKS